jgi:putative transposase
MLGSIVGAIINRPTNDIIQLSKCGAIVNNAINDISNHYPNVFVDKYIIMPNHIYMILLL